MKRLLRILIGCEFSGIVRSAFERRGWEAWSCDYLPTEIPSLFHYQGDIRDILSECWDAAIFHPCTYLVTSDNRWFGDPRYPDREKHREEAIEFVKMLWDQPHIPHIAIENPMGILPRYIGKYNQVIHPYQFGHDRAKATCLWTKNLPTLRPTSMVPPRITEDGKKRWGNQVDASGADRTPPGKDRWKLRSRTDLGIARAMAAQWGIYIESLAL